ncbi:exodeoxyribonuclease VII small subunit [Synechococcus sp. Nb3U1]|uniref:exodeoxyribonuclease VII small subunit n=1 Tax=Synechococcus sp. Nb3U1 TaxID=1914529 RepID=UPI001F38EAE7|nr:exodeoxyribonuclease VII small subunit [Synechococcus sp. Nb3U1]MCF2970716.1 exodeoxyribonuclease VII small subunit [Synechococcus sp. Nb3U1]
MKQRQGGDPWRYEVAIAEVETLIDQIESGELDLAEVVERFQQAAQTLKTCEAFLQQKRQQVEIIIEQLEQVDQAEELEEF